MLCTIDLILGFDVGMCSIVRRDSSNIGLVGSPIPCQCIDQPLFVAPSIHSRQYFIALVF